MRRFSMLALFLTFCPTILAQDVPKVDTPKVTTDPPTVGRDQELHDELRAFHKSIVSAVVKRDVDAQLKLAHPKVIATWQNAQVVKGHDGLKKFYDENAADQKVFVGYKQEPTPDDLTILHGGDTGISYGSTVGIYNLGGKEVELTNRWTAVMVKEDSEWRMAAYHVSVNALDNPLLDYAKGFAWRAGGIGVAGGVILGIAFAMVACRSRKKAS